MACLLLSSSRLLGRSVHADHEGVVTLVSLQRKLFKGLDVLLPELGNLTGVDGSSRGSRVNAVGLDGDDDMAAALQELVRIHGHDTGLIWLGNIGEDDVNHTDEHAVALGHTGILDDGDNVGALLGHVQQITAHAVGELDGINQASGTDPVSDVRDSGTSRSTEVQNLLPRSDEDVADATEDTGSELGAERIPHAILHLGAIRPIDGDTLLTIDRVADDHVAGT